jgi:hypothetical protein
LPIIEQANGFGAVAVGFTRLGRNIMESRISLRQQCNIAPAPMGSQCYQQLPSAVYHWTIENRMCTLCYIDDAMKKNIAAWGAAFRQATKSPFGSSDEIGMLNLITHMVKIPNRSCSFAISVRRSVCFGSRAPSRFSVDYPLPDSKVRELGRWSV